MCIFQNTTFLAVSTHLSLLGTSHFDNNPILVGKLFSFLFPSDCRTMCHLFVALQSPTGTEAINKKSKCPLQLTMPAPMLGKPLILELLQSWLGRFFCTIFSLYKTYRSHRLINTKSGRFSVFRTTKKSGEESREEAKCCWSGERRCGTWSANAILQTRIGHFTHGLFRFYKLRVASPIQNFRHLSLGYSLEYR